MHGIMCIWTISGYDRLKIPQKRNQLHFQDMGTRIVLISAIFPFVQVFVPIIHCRMEDEGSKVNFNNQISLFINQTKMRKSLILFIVLLATLIFAALTENKLESRELEAIAINNE